MMKDLGWCGQVESHPTATSPQLLGGLQVKVRGLPFPEQVTPGHRYWAREKAGTVPAWVEAGDLRPGQHKIGLPADMTVEAAPAVSLLTLTGKGKASRWVTVPGRDSRLDDPEWWWLLGYWWGNGHLHHARHNRVAGLTASVPSADTVTIQRVLRLFRSTGRTSTPTPRPGCVQITLTDATLGVTLARWYDSATAGWSRKTPPDWVERLSLDCQRELVRGYWDADGDHFTRDGAIIGSVSLNGLLALRRILLRFGVASSIRLGGKPTTRIQGRLVTAQQPYSIRFWKGIEQFGLTHRFRGRYSLPSAEDGVLWGRVTAVAEIPPEKFWPITTATGDYLTAFGRSHNSQTRTAQRDQPTTTTSQGAAS
jgi:hypothetical protein